MKNKKKLKVIINKYINKIICGGSWDIAKYKKNMIKSIERIMNYKDK